MDTASEIIIAGSAADFPARADETSPACELDDDQLAMLEELRTPLEKVWADEFHRYCELFYRYVPKRPYHVRYRYGDGFVRAKGRYKGRDENYDRACYPALLGKHLDYWRWQHCRAGKDHPPNFWLAMHAGRKSSVSAIDFDAKEYLLGYYADVTGAPRPLPTLPLPEGWLLRYWRRKATPGRVTKATAASTRRAARINEARSGLSGRYGYESKKSTSIVPPLTEGRSGCFAC